jgi:UDP:flavonoid glycosyltransferase YjiC (YdhE family)
LVLAGIPQIVLPKYQEQGLTGKVLQQLGVARTIPRPTSQKMETAIQQIPQLFEQAQMQAQQLSSWNYNYLKDLQIW